MGQSRIFSVSAVPVASVREGAEAIADAATASDGTSPFDEHTRLSLRTATGEASGQRHILLVAADQTVGYARLDLAQPGGAAGAEFAVHPHARRQGHGAALLSALGDVHRQTRPGREALEIWSHGDQIGARVLAGRYGFVVVRSLMQLRRSLRDPISDVAFPDGVMLRSFRPGKDDAEWLAVNARAFAHHPEQGRTTQADLDARIGEAWFDPAGFLIAERDGSIIGFHWTKIHPESEDRAGERLGEVYVVGVDPAHHGGGLGKALTAAGLRHLQQRGLETVLLYVESDNEPALAVYHRLEFRTFSTDVMYGSTEPGLADTGE